VRTKLFNHSYFVVHFFDARQMKRCFGYAETRRKRVQGDSKSPCRSPGLCALCTCGPKLFREAASPLFSGERETFCFLVGQGPHMDDAVRLVRTEPLQIPP